MLSIEVSSDHTYLVAPMLWTMVNNGVVDHIVFERCAKMMRSDNLTIYDKALLY